MRSNGYEIGLLAEVCESEKEPIPPKMETARKVSRQDPWPANCNCRSPMRGVSTIALLLLLFAAAGTADVVRILDDDREAMQARADIIRQAKTRVTMLYFLARDDRVTLAVLGLLRDARRRGVGDVRAIVDGSFHRIP